MKKTGQYQVPFDKNGNVLHYTDSHQGVSMRANHVFADELVISRIMSNCRSGGYVKMRSIIDSRTYPMFLSVFNSLVEKMDRGVLRGSFTFKKRGQNFSLAYVEANP